ncbi:MAG: hypothetical protein HY355_05540 [Armatimonadetes bacterium]|nr:hypothetical protein [Armatimonadota bacterium]
MSRRTWGVLALVVAVGAGWAVLNLTSRTGPGRPPAPEGRQEARPAATATPTAVATPTALATPAAVATPGAVATTPAAAPPARTSTPAPTPAGEPQVPAELPTAEPGLDRALARDYRRALEGQGIRIIALAITDRRKAGGARRADIVYQTKTTGAITALRPEIVRIAGPATNPRLALDLITVRAARRDGVILATVSIAVPDIDRWLKTQISDDEFYATWAVRTPGR